MNVENISLTEKYTLTIKETSILFRIGQKKLYKLVQDNPTADFILMNGNRVQIKRKLFEQFIDETTAI